MTQGWSSLEFIINFSLWIFFCYSSSFLLYWISCHKIHTSFFLIFSKVLWFRLLCCFRTLSDVDINPYVSQDNLGLIHFFIYFVTIFIFSVAGLSSYLRNKNICYCFLLLIIFCVICDILNKCSIFILVFSHGYVIFLFVNFVILIVGHFNITRLMEIFCVVRPFVLQNPKWIY